MTNYKSYANNDVADDPACFKTFIIQAAFRFQCAIIKDLSSTKRNRTAYCTVQALYGAVAAIPE